MRRTKHRRRYHTGRVISNRQRRQRRLDRALWVDGTGTWVLPNGRLDDTDRYHDCGRPRCLLCHWDKFDPSRRAREKRGWRREVDLEMQQVG
jgi:hypothetical protein